MDRLSEEEIKAIEKLSSKKNETTWYDTIRQIKREEITDVVVTRQKYITILLNLIEKQQKEIEQEKEKNGILQEELNNKIKALDIAMSNPDYISKDKIREILNKYDEQSKVKNIYWYEIEKDLQELLQEGDDK